MGLLNRKTNKLSPNSVEKYLLRGSDDLLVRSGVEIAFRFYARAIKHGGGMHMNMNGRMEIRFTDLDRLVPRRYWKKEIDSETILTLAYNRGSGKAAFYLGVLYEHGILVEKDYKKAMDYYMDAIRSKSDDGELNEGKVLAIARIYLLNKQFNPFIMSKVVDKEEGIAISIFIRSEGEMESELLELFQNKEYLINEFFLLGKRLVAFYACKNYPYSLFMMGTYLINPDYEMCDYYSLIVCPEPEEVRCAGNKFLRQLIDIANSGDKKAASVVYEISNISS